MSGRRGRVLESFPSTYLTLTSIIQGVALGYLVTVFDDARSAYGVANYLLAASTFLIIVSAWHEYMVGATAFRWIPQLWDSAIPFALGASEIAMIRSLADERDLAQWFMAAAVVAVIAAVALFNMYVNVTRGQTEPPPSGRVCWHMRLALALSMCVAGVFVASAGLLSQVHSNAIESAVAAMALGLVIVFLTRSVPYWKTLLDD
jgi:hypothetical protein